MATVYSENDQLGTLRGKYGANLHSAKLNLYFDVFGLALLGTGFIILGISNTSPALSLNFLGLGLVGLLIATGIYFFAYRGLLKTQVTVHDQGFSFHDWCGRNHFYRWDEITAIYVHITRNRAGLILREDYTVQRTDGQKVTLSSHQIEQIAQLGLILQREVSQRLLPQSLERIQRGDQVAFGKKLSLSREGIHSGRHLLPWPEVDTVKFNHRSISIYQKGKKNSWQLLIASTIPNPVILKAIVDRYVNGS